MRHQAGGRQPCCCALAAIGVAYTIFKLGAEHTRYVHRAAQDGLGIVTEGKAREAIDTRSIGSEDYTKRTVVFFMLYGS